MIGLGEDQLAAEQNRIGNLLKDLRHDPVESLPEGNLLRRLKGRYVLRSLEASSVCNSDPSEYEIPEGSHQTYGLDALT
jgi:hypothetical protein